MKTFLHASQFGLAIVVALMCGIGAFHYNGALAAGIPGLLVFMICRAEADGASYKLVKHLWGLAAYAVIVLILALGVDARHSNGVRFAKVFESCVEAGSPMECSDAMKVLFNISMFDYVDWKKTVAACRNKPDFVGCIKGLTQVSNGATVVISHDDVRRMCPHSNRAECFADLQKNGFAYSRLSIDETPDVPKKD